MPADERPDVTEMKAIHGVFRKTFGFAPGLVRGVAGGDTERSELVGSVVADVAEVLHLHHSGEDDLMMPKLRERSGQRELVDRLAGQHEDIHEPLDRVRSLAAAFRTSASKADGEALVAALADLEAAAVPHLDEEEAVLMPLVEEHVTVEEWDELPGHTMAAFTGDLFFIIGMVREEMTQEQRDRMISTMPPPLVEAWQGVGLDAYRSKAVALVSG